MLSPRLGLRPKTITDGASSVKVFSNIAVDSIHDKMNRSSIGQNYMGVREVILLVSVGVVAGAASGLTLWASDTLSRVQVSLILGQHKLFSPGGYFLSSVALAIASALIIKHFCKQAAGSGLPEFKSILAGEMRPAERVRLVSFRIFVAKVIGLILATGSGLSIGTEGPLVHIAACIAQLLMTHITEFAGIMDSPSLSKQIFAASAAVGIASAFNAPVGGLLFSVEITSTFYLISNYWKSFVASMAGAFACSLFLITQQNLSDTGAVLEMTASDAPYVKWELFIFLLMGFIFAYLARLYLNLTQTVHLLMKPYCKRHPIITCAVVAGITSTVIYFTRAYSRDGLRVFNMASDVLTTGYIAELRSFKVIPPLAGILISVVARVFVTILGFNLPIPAGLFVPVFLMGGLLGRFVGILVVQAGHTEAYLPGYALAGGCAFASGVTQTISVAVLAAELTGNLSMLLPCLIASVVAAGVTRTMGLSVYDQAMFNKGLESLQLLLQESIHGFRCASDVMCTGSDVVCIPRMCSPIRLIHTLDENNDSQFPLVTDTVSRKLLGTLDRQDIFEYLKSIFLEKNRDELLAKLLQQDHLDHDERVSRMAAKAIQKRMRSKFVSTFNLKSYTDKGETEPSDTLFGVNPSVFASESIGGADNVPHTGLNSSPIEVMERGTKHNPKDNQLPKPAPTRVGSLPFSSIPDEMLIESRSPEGPHTKLRDIGDCEGGLGCTDFSSSAVCDQHDTPLSDPVDQGGRKLRSPSMIEKAVGKVSHFLSLLPENHGHPLTYPLPSAVEVGGQSAAHGPTSRFRSLSIESEVEAFHTKHRSRSTSRDALVGGTDAMRSIVGDRATRRLRGESVVSNTVDGLSELEEDCREHLQSTAAAHDEADFRDALNIEIDLLQQRYHSGVGTQGYNHLAVSAFPFSVTRSTSMEHIYVLFEMIKLLHIYVLDNGVLCGIISRNKLLDRLKSCDRGTKKTW